MRAYFSLILCGSDPYVVVGEESTFGLTPDLVSGPATSTSAGIDLIKKLTGVRAGNGRGPDATADMAEFPAYRLDVNIGQSA